MPTSTRIADGQAAEAAPLLLVLGRRSHPKVAKARAPKAPAAFFLQLHHTNTHAKANAHVHTRQPSHAFLNPFSRLFHPLALSPQLFARLPKSPRYWLQPPGSLGNHSETPDSGLRPTTTTTRWTYHVYRVQGAFDRWPFPHPTPWFVDAHDAKGAKPQPCNQPKSLEACRTTMQQAQGRPNETPITRF
ncbi:hypothetical protein COCSADRAFT_191068 [Bipolaris sorokiniana ND90Pr]|uniref:Uncharacterized protein n=1 Tax=Cochliobolus sativus (strain ND90Pr / ATCC 201652) TaxID=665912 RepID=M2T4I6_COCSN|nr:uncharacterized protein COCSADRAFT_191068 [Bipolaris sorokiniana ND90Pr]EMD63932.1 hypothetical protein COCSADRAFT_191068 [Bipolaris sorokiniana ND90Pr]